MGVLRMRSSGRSRVHTLLFSLSIALVTSTAVGAADWLQFQYDAANRGRAPQAVEPPFQLRWVWYGENNVVVCGKPYPAGNVPRPPADSVGRLSFTMHAVVADRRVIFGDLEGKLYCLDARNGSAVWKRQFPGAFVHAAAIAKLSTGNVILASCQDGCVYALDWKGEQIWHYQTDAPLVTPAKTYRDTALVSSLDGRMIAFDPATGAVKWHYNAGAPIRQPAAIADGRVFFGSEDMIFHAIDAATGKRLWRTAKGQMTGQSFRNTWPVVVGDKVMTFQILIDGQSEFVMEALLYNATAGIHNQKRLEDWPRERDAILAWLSGDMTWAVDCNKGWQKDPGKIHPGSRSLTWAGGPLRKSFYVFDVRGDGHGGAVEPYQVPMGIVGGTGNANMGPVLDAKGRPITWWRVSARSIITGGSFGTSFCPDLSALDLRTGDRIILPTQRNTNRGGPGMELDNHHMLSAAGQYIYYHNPFRQARWVRLDGKQNPAGAISAAYGRHDGGGWSADVVYYPTKKDAGPRARHMYDSHGAARTPVLIADNALIVNEIDLRAMACYETQSSPPRLVSDAIVDTPKLASKAPSSGLPEGTNRGLAEYLWQKCVVNTIGSEADRLRTRLADHIEAMIEAGHLLPYYTRRGETHPQWYFTNPGDTVTALARAYPHLPETTQPRLIDYLRREMAAYPPFGDRLNTPDDQGASRMAFEVPKHKRRWQLRTYRRLPRIHNLYGLWLYTDTTGDVDYIRHNWKSIRSFYQQQKEDIRLYAGGVSGPIGLARLARLIGDVDTERAAERDAFAAFRTLDNLPAMQGPMAGRWGLGRKGSDPFLYCGFHFQSLTSEVARYVRDHPAVYRYVCDHTEAAIDHWPMWFVSQASGFSRYYGESHALPPIYTALIFPIKALVKRSDPSQLRVWVDAEDAPRGDLFFIHRLVLAIEAYGHKRWVEVR